MSREFHRKLKLAVDIVDGVSAEHDLLVCVSGGKDSVALAGVVSIVADRTGRDFDAAHMSTPLNPPGTEETAIETCSKTGLSLDVREPEKDVWELLREIPSELSVLDGKGSEMLGLAIASGNMLHAYGKERGIEGVYTGMRAEESKGRRLNERFRGSFYHVEHRGWTCNPLRGWTAADVFATAISLELPIHPHYRLALEKLGVDPESQRSRVDCIVTNENVTSLGAMAVARHLYPKLWRQIAEIRPEIESAGR